MTDDFKRFVESVFGEDYEKEFGPVDLSGYEKDIKAPDFSMDDFIEKMTSENPNEKKGKGCKNGKEKEN